MNRRILNDIFLGLGVMIFALVIILIANVGVNGENLKAEIWYKDELLDTINLANQISLKTKTYSFEEGTVVIEYKTNAIRVISSDCPNKTCVNEGWSTSPKHPIICMEMNFRILIDSNFNSYDVVIP